MKSSLARGVIWVSLLGLCLAALPGWAATAVLLDANFNDKPLNTPIGTGGASVGEPIFVNSELQATVRDALFTSPSLYLKNLNGSIHSSHRIMFELLDGAEVQNGYLLIAFKLRAPSTLTNFSFIIREQGSSANQYASLLFGGSGSIQSSDGTGQLLNIGTYSPGDTLRVEYFYDLGAGTYDLFVNDAVLIANRPHGVVDLNSGIGTLGFAPTQNGVWAVDDILVTHATPNTVLLEADFNDKPTNTQIGTGGPGVGEPTSLSSGLSAIVRTAPLASRSLHISQSTITSQKTARFEFLDGDQAHTGELRIGFTVRTPPVLDTFRVRMRQPATSGDLFGGIEFNSSGQVRTLDAPGGNTTLLSYSPNQTLRFTLIYQVASATYDIDVDGQRVLSGAEHGVSDAERGIGAVDVSLTGNTAQTWVFDDLNVKRLPLLLDANFNNQPLNQQIPTFGASNGQPVSIDAGLTARTRANLFPTTALALSQSTTGLARFATFEFPQQAEIIEGDLRVGMRVLPPASNDRFTINIHEQGSSSVEFGTLSFLSNGDIRLFDSSGSLVVGSYVPGVSQQFDFRYHLDAGKYDLYVDRQLKSMGRAIPTNRGIGRITAGTTVSTSGTWVVDDLQVYQTSPQIDDRLFADGFE